MRDKSFIIVEYLTLRAWLCCLMPWLLRTRSTAKARPTACFFIDTTSMGLAVAQWSARLIGVRIEKLNFRLVDIHDEMGRLVRLRIACQDFREVLRLAMREPVFQAVVDRAPGPNRLKTFLAKSIGSMNDVSRSNTLWRTLLIIHACVAKRTQMEAEGWPSAGGIMLFLIQRPWMKALRHYAAGYDIKILTYSRPVALGSLARTLLTLRGAAAVRALRVKLFECRLRSRAVQGMAVPVSRAGCAEGFSDSPRADPSSRRTEKSGRTAQARIVVDYQGLLNLNQPQRYSDLFFWQQSSLSGEDLLLAFAFPQDPLDGSKWTELAMHGMKAVALYPGAATVPSTPVFAYWPRHTGTQGRAALTDLRGRSEEEKWLRRRTKEYYLLRDYWRELFERYHAKVYLSWYRFDENHCVIADGMRDVGGITAIYQRAYQPDPSADITVDAELMFGYSPLDADVERRSGSIIQYHVAVGYFWDHLFPLLRHSAEDIRTNLKQAGAQFILAYFDENSCDDARWHTGHEFMRVNYAFLLEKVLEDSRLGLVLKPKRPPTLRKRLGPVVDLLERALATGRCQLLEAGALNGAHPPAEAALASDLVIHGHLCAATAGLEAAMAGVPTLLLDREGWPEGSLYRLGEGRVVFRTWPALWEALEDYRLKPGRVPGFGDWSPMLDEMDPFRDGRGAERMGTYIQWVVEGFKEGLDRETVLADAAERYTQKWGSDKVTQVQGATALGKNNMGGRGDALFNVQTLKSERGRDAFRH